MNKIKIIKNATAFAREKLSQEGTGHDWWHIERVRNNGTLLCAKEKADAFIVDLALLLHDVGDRKVIHKDEDDHSIAEHFLRLQKVDDEIVEHIMFIIKNMSFSHTYDKGNERKNHTTEFLVVQDADRLDAIGAIGIARAFTFGGSKGRLLYDPHEKAAVYKNSKGYKKGSSSTLHHFYEKLFLLKDLMNTKAGKNIAKKRHEYMRKFVDQFLAEWQGKR